MRKVKTFKAFALMLAFGMLAGCGGQKLSERSKVAGMEAGNAAKELNDKWTEQAEHILPATDSEANRAAVASIVGDWTKEILNDKQTLEANIREAAASGKLSQDTRDLLKARTKAANQRVIVWQSLAKQIKRDGTAEEVALFEKWKAEMGPKVEGYAAKMTALHESVEKDFAKPEKKPK